jgi:hypothetical protein
MHRNQPRASQRLARFDLLQERRQPASKNVETLRTAHEHWNRRDFAGVIRNTAEGLLYTDNARGLNLKVRDKFREWTEAWATAFSDPES